jgi:hypothetical protein
MPLRHAAAAAATAGLQYCCHCAVNYNGACSTACCIKLSMYSVPQIAQHCTICSVLQPENKLDCSYHRPTLTHIYCHASGVHHAILVQTDGASPSTATATTGTGTGTTAVLDGATGRADGVAVYQKRAASLVLCTVLGPR